jgi:hypothetical protein
MHLHMINKICNLEELNFQNLIKPKLPIIWNEGEQILRICYNHIFWRKANCRKHATISRQTHGDRSMGASNLKITWSLHLHASTNAEIEYVVTCTNCKNATSLHKLNWTEHSRHTFQNYICSPSEQDHAWKQNKQRSSHVMLHLYGI